MTGCERTLLAVLTVAGTLVSATAQAWSGTVGKPAPMSVPALPHYDWKACPFEACGYRGWTALKAITVYDTWKDTRQSVAELAAGDKVTALTGVVITTKPGVVRMDRDLPEAGLKRGDRLLVYTYRGEGFAAVWVHGVFYPWFDISFTRWPNGQGCGGEHCAAKYLDFGEHVWWAQLRLRSGRTGWVQVDPLSASFYGMDVRQ